MTHCEQYGHEYDKLYPQSRYYCPQCETIHGTCAVNGAVYWGCMKCWSEGRRNVEQVYVGRKCRYCDHLDKTGAKFELLPEVA